MSYTAYHSDPLPHSRLSTSGPSGFWVCSVFSGPRPMQVPNLQLGLLAMEGRSVSWEHTVMPLVLNMSRYLV